MTKYRYYITSVFDGKVYGTDSTEVAESYRDSEDDFVIDTETGAWLTYDNEIEVEERK